MNSVVINSSYIKKLYELDKDLFNKLNDLKYKSLTNGHRVILAKAIADSISLPNETVTDFSIWFIGCKSRVTSILDNISYFVFIDDKDSVIKLIKDFTQWRYSLVYNPPRVVAMRGPENAIEELSGLLNYVDTAALSTTLDVYSDINHYYNLFRTVATLNLD